MRTFLLLSALTTVAAAVACTQMRSTPAVGTTPSAALASQSDGPLAATIDFGRDSLGSPFPPPSGHDMSGNSRDSLFPAEVTIKTGGTVTFVMGTSGVHEVAIYAPGTGPKDIDVTKLDPPAATCPPVPVINDPTNRIAQFEQACEGGPAAPTYTFTTPGRYFVICNFLPHFQSGMYGWVTVKD